MSHADERPKEVFAVGASYEPYVGRWSRKVARDFLQWREGEGSAGGRFQRRTGTGA